MKVSVTFSFPDDVRRAVAHRVGNKRPATHAEMKQYVEGVITAELESIVPEYEADIACDECGCHPHLPRRCGTCGCKWERQ